MKSDIESVLAGKQRLAYKLMLARAVAMTDIERYTKQIDDIQTEVINYLLEERGKR